MDKIESNNNQEITGVECQRCKNLNATRYRQNTLYTNEESNFVTLCPGCAKENNDYWNDMWKELRNNIM